MDLTFNFSKKYTIGTEIELQILDSHNVGLVSKSSEVLDAINRTKHPGIIKPEIARSMLEINTHIHGNISSLTNELMEIKDFLTPIAKRFKIRFSGGGIHPIQKWQDTQITQKTRYKRIYEIYNYLAKQDAVFGQHIHIGCTSGKDAIYLTHILARYIPHFIALSASSPFYQGVATLFHSVRVGLATKYPTSGCIPFIKSWKSFSEYFNKMHDLNIIESMKDIYWDIRPKPEFGTVEIRICDTPLTLEKSILLTAYIQSLAHYILEEHPYDVVKNIYLLYPYNRFQAARYGFDGEFIDPYSEKITTIGKDILATAKKIKIHATLLGNDSYINKLIKMTAAKQNDAKLSSNIYKKVKSLQKTVRIQSKMWMQN